MSKTSELLDTLISKINPGKSGKSVDILSTLKKELILTINLQVQKKPPGWMVRKKAFAEVLTMIKNIEGEVCE